MKNLWSKAKQNQTILTLGNYLSGEASIKALGLVSIPLITRLIEPAEYGFISIYTALISLFVIIIPLNLHVSLRRI